jgi:hypothetical protein
MIDRSSIKAWGAWLSTDEAEGLAETTTEFVTKLVT